MRNWWKAGFFILFAAVLIGANIFAWYFFVIKGKAPAPTPTVTIKPTVAPTPAPTVDETALIKQTVYKKTGLNETTAEVTINKNTGKHATGNIKEFEAVGGAYWLAAKTSTGWVCVYDGQSQPTCEQIAPYNFPKDMVPECLDAANNLIKR